MLWDNHISLVKLFSKVSTHLCSVDTDKGHLVSEWKTKLVVVVDRLWHCSVYVLLRVYSSCLLEHSVSDKARGCGIGTASVCVCVCVCVCDESI